MCGRNKTRRWGLYVYAAGGEMSQARVVDEPGRELLGFGHELMGKRADSRCSDRSGPRLRIGIGITTITNLNGTKSDLMQLVRSHISNSQKQRTKMQQPSVSAQFNGSHIVASTEMVA
jgi:hypothetical protein